MTGLLPEIPVAIVCDLGWTLIHFLWQGLVLAAALNVILPLCRSALEAPRPSPSARGFYGAGSAGAGTVPATLSGVTEGGGCTRSSGFAACRGHREAELAA